MWELIWSNGEERESDGWMDSDGQMGRGGGEEPDINKVFLAVMIFSSSMLWTLPELRSQRGGSFLLEFCSVKNSIGKKNDYI